RRSGDGRGRRRLRGREGRPLDAPGAMNVLDLTRELLRFNTINPPGEEEACGRHLARMLEAGGFTIEEHAFAPRRTSLVARLGGGGPRRGGGEGRPRTYRLAGPHRSRAAGRRPGAARRVRGRDGERTAVRSWLDGNEERRRGIRGGTPRRGAPPRIHARRRAR